MTPDGAMNHLLSIGSDAEHVEEYVYGPDDPEAYFSTVVTLAELEADYAEYEGRV